ncbi:MAG TPA: arylsulfotransferase family protein [Solirubrobacteraceae bacterium]|nr:arylsulfotransferase family protein [Solirubrobacteraceae bacterium]
MESQIVLALSPAPGTPDASPQTQISVLGTKPALVRGVDVRAARTGAHAGRLRAYSGKRGVSFLPAQPFAEGEKVDVTLRLAHHRARRWSFTVATAGRTPPILNITTTQPDKLQSFVSEPGLRAPKILVRKQGAAGSGSAFLTPLPSPVVHPGSTQTVTLSPVGPGGPMIIDGRGRLVWFKQLTPPDVAANLRVQRYHGRRVLTWWQGPVTAAAYGLGAGVIADSSYRTIKTVRAGNGYAMDIHEFTLAGRDALFTIYQPVIHDGVPLIDAIVQQVDIATGLVVWEWHSLGHIPLAQSYATPANSATYDAFHINSVQAVRGGRVLISARDTSAVYLIRRAGSRILWTLGGKASDFRLGPGARFWFQHDARLLRGGRVSVFDDEAGPPQKAPRSRGLILRLRGRRATVARVLHRPGQTSAQSEGSVQSLPGGGHFVGFGAEPWFTQFDAAGRVVFDARLPVDDGSYRAYRFPWHAKPRTRPAAVLRDGFVYASWNGATEVAAWKVGGTRVARSGFETKIPVSGSGPFVVRALDPHGRVLGTATAS